LPSARATYGVTVRSERGRGRLVWLVVGVVIAALVGLALFRTLGTFVFALFLYYATRPLYARLNSALDHPNLAVTLTLVAIVAPILLVVGYGFLQALIEVDQFLATHSLEGYRRYLQPYLSLVRSGQLRQLWSTVVDDPSQPLPLPVQQLVGRLFGQLSTIFGLVVTVLGHLFLLSVFLFYFLRDDHKLAAWFARSVGHGRVVGFLSAVDDDLETVFFSNLAIVAVSGGIATVTFYLLNLVAPGRVVSIPILLGLLIGIATLVPVVGMKLIYVPFTVYLAALAFLTPTPLWHPVVFFVVTAVVVDLIPDFFVRSYLSAQSGVHMGLVLLGYILGSISFGWYGLFVGPVIVVFAVQYAHRVFPDLASEVDFG